MDAVIRQLEWVRRWGKRLLLLQRLSQWLAVLLPALVGLALLDFVLRMPGWMRLALVLGVAGAALGWLGLRMTRAWRFRPTLTDLALRAERLFPALEGKFASAVEFHAESASASRTAHTKALTDESVRQAERLLQHMSLTRLLNPTLTLRYAGVALVAIAFAGALVLGLPEHARIAAQRYAMPFSDAAWPRRQQVANLNESDVLPVDAPVRLQARLERGYTPSLRVRAQYRVVEDGHPGAWQSVLLTEQARANENAKADEPVFETLIELPWSLRQTLTGAEPGRAYLEYVFAAGDDMTDPHRIDLAARPEVVNVTAEINPPAYATGLVAAQHVALHEQTSPVATAAGLAGSTVRLHVAFNKPVPTGADALASLLEAMPDADAVRLTSTPDRTAVTADLTLRQTAEFAIRTTDEHGLSNLSEKTYRLEAIEDKLPAVSLTDPAADQSVLPTAVLPVAAMGQDDVGVEELSIDAQLPDRRVSDAQDTDQTVSLTQRIGRSATLVVEHELDLSQYDLRPGDTMTLIATAVDGFVLGEERHAPVASAPRVLRIIDAAALVTQIRNELAAVRQQAVRLEQTQQRISEEADPNTSDEQQADLNRRLEAQDKQVAQLQNRAAMNRLQEPALGELMNTARQLLKDARAASGSAEKSLQQAEQADAAAQQESATDAERQAQRKQAEQAREQAKQAQQQVRTKLDELAAALDQGAAALALQSELSRIAAEQDALAEMTRKLLPRTAGQSVEDLPAEQREQLRELAQRQEELAREAQEFVRKSRATAGQMRSQGQSDREQATADVLDEVADLAERRGLSQDMQQASQAGQQNQLSQAGQSQMSAQQTLSQMNQAMGKREQKQQEVLRRRLAQLAEIIEQLIQRQEAQITALDAIEPAMSDRLPALAAPMTALRQATLAAQQRAGVDESTAEVARLLGEAVAAQGRAILALRDADKSPAKVGENESLDNLRQALTKVQEQQGKQQDNQTQEQREQLRQAYMELSKKQQALRERAAQMQSLPELNRRQRAELRTMGGEQGEIQAAAAELGKQVEQTLVFKKTHERIDVAAGRANERLTGSEVDALVLADQQRVAMMLGSMADALEQARDDDEFHSPSDGGGGGGGGGQGQPPQLVPDIAELKLLRSMQEMVYQQTREVSELKPELPDAEVAPMIEELGGQQRELHDLGGQMLEKLKRKAAEGAAAPRA